jgi:hypothetical protein
VGHLSERKPAWQASGALGNQPCVRLAKATSVSMTGTSMSTPTTVASAAPESSPNRLMATATASSKKLDGADHGGGCGHVEGQAQQARAKVAQREDAVALDDQRHGDERHALGLGEDGLGLKAEEQHHREQQAQTWRWA